MRINLGVTKVFVLKCREGYLLIDTGYKGDYGKFRRKIKKAGIEYESIKYLLITHYHDDHAGFAQKMKDELKLRLIVQKKSVNLLKKGDSGVSKGEHPLNKRVEFVMNIFMKFHRNFKFPPVLTDTHDIIVDGDDDGILRNIGIRGRIIHTPGHTHDSMSVVMDNGDVFCGDVAMNFLNFTGTKHRPIFLNGIEEVYESWRKILNSGAGKIFPAHGKPFPAEKLKVSMSYFSEKAARGPLK